MSDLKQPQVKECKGSRLIALSGKMGSGKSTIAASLVGHGFDELSFADPLKQSIYILFGIPSVWLYDPTLKNKIYEPLGVSPRELMQTFADLMRVDLHTRLPKLKFPYAPSLFANRLALSYKALKPGANVVISDQRFDDEVDLTESLGFVSYRVERPDLKDSKHSGHASEAGCRYHQVINNDSTLDNLKKMARHIGKCPTCHHLHGEPAGALDQTDPPKPPVMAPPGSGNTATQQGPTGGS